MKDWFRRNWKNLLIVIFAFLFVVKCSSNGNHKRLAESLQYDKDSVEVVLKNTRDTLKLTRDTLLNVNLYSASTVEELEKQGMKNDEREKTKDRQISELYKQLSEKDRQIAQKDKQIDYWMQIASQADTIKK